MGAKKLNTTSSTVVKFLQPIFLQDHCGSPHKKFSEIFEILILTKVVEKYILHCSRRQNQTLQITWEMSHRRPKIDTLGN